MPKIQCPECSVTSYRRDNIERHVREQHRQVLRQICAVCGERFWQHHSMVNHYQQFHREVPRKDIPTEVFPVGI